MSIKFILPVLFALLLNFGLNAQISAVNYDLKFNLESNLFDCYLKIKEGSAKTMRERGQFNAQITIVAPTGSSIQIVKNYMPLQNNQNFGGVIPMKWTIANTAIKPASDPFNDYLSITPSLAPSAFYNELKEGESILLFSLKVDNIFDCGESVRIFENNTDLSSSAIGFDGGDFSNGFTVGGVQQKYTGNEAKQTPTLQVIDHIAQNNNKVISLTAVLKPASEFGPFKAEWSGPNGFYGEDLNVLIANPRFDQYGKYNLLVTDARGCQEQKEILVENPNKDLTPNHALAVEETTSTELISANNEVDLKNNIQVFPNPASDVVLVTINSQKSSVVKGDVMDQRGRIIIKNAIDSKILDNNQVFQIQVDQLPSGIYNLLVNVNGQETSKQIVVVK